MDGDCLPHTDIIDVECGELVEIRLAAPPCPASSPTSPGSSLGVTSEGTKVVTGESVVLEVTASDACGNSAAASWDPAAEPSPDCEEVLADRTCCPPIAPPAPPDCHPAACGEPLPLRALGNRPRDVTVSPGRPW